MKEEVSIEDLRRRLLNIILAFIAVMTVAVVLIAFAAGRLPGMHGISMRYSSPPDDLYRASAMMLIGTIATAAIKQRWPSAARVFFLGFLTIFALVSDSSGQVAGGRSQFVLFIPLVMSSMLWRPWAAFAVAGVESAMSSIAEINMGHIPYFPYIFALFLVATVCYTITNGLEQKVTFLLQRDLLLRTAADVSRIAASGRSLDILLNEVANLIRERFGLYYVGLFLTDETGRWAVLHTGTGEAGQRMVAQGHRLEIGGVSMISQCIVQKKAVVAPNVQDANVRFDNPLLPDTRSEAAFPLLLGDGGDLRRSRPVIGALTVQSDRANAFDQNTQVALQAMADQTAVSIDGAQTYMRYREIVNIQSELIVRFRPDGTIVYANPAFCRFFGDNTPEGRHVLDVMGIQNEGWERVYQVLIKAIPRVYEEYQVTSQDQLRWMEFTSSMIEGGYQIVGRDVTDRVLAQHNLAESEHLYRSLIKYAPIGIVLIDEQGRILDINDRLLEILGSPSREETMAINVLEFPPLVNAGVKDRFRQCLQTQNEVIQDKGWYTSRMGKRVYLQYYLAPILLPSGQKTVLALALDYTEQKAMEAQVSHMLRMESIARLTGGIVHDFNNYLTVIIGNAELGKESAEMEQIKQAAEQAKALTARLLAFSRKQPFIGQTRILDINVVISDMQPMLQSMIGEDIDLRMALNGTLPILADPTQIEQVVMNLVVNAHDAMLGSGRLDIATTDTDNGFLELCVSDTGAGIDPEVMAHIFEPFFTTKGNGDGTGLGLSTVYSIVSQSGGHIEVETELGRGTTFRIYFPQAVSVESSLLPASVPPSEAEITTGNETILVVEDSPLVRELIVNVLERNGYTVLQAANVSEALAYQADLLVTDFVLPDGTGPQIAERLKCKMLLMSGYTPGSGRQAGLSGMRHFLPKPFTPHSLAVSVRRALDDDERL